MPAYIPYFGTQQGPPPYLFTGVRLLVLVLQADVLQLEAYCDEFLGVDPARVFAPAGPYVILGINQYPSMISEHDSFKGFGFTSQNEYFVMFPAVRFDNVRGFLLPREVTWVFPYIGVDNPTSASAGREMLGFPKMVGEIAVDQDPQGRLSATVAMPGFKAFSPSTPQEMLELITIRTGLPLQITAPASHAFPWDFLDLAGGAELLEEAAQTLIGAADADSFSVTNLKQFCDPTNPSQAVYQALVRAVWAQENTGPATFYDGAQVEVFDNVTMRILEHLGLGQAAGAALQPLVVASMTTDMRFGQVTHLFVAS